MSLNWHGKDIGFYMGFLKNAMMNSTWDLRGQQKQTLCDIFTTIMADAIWRTFQRISQRKAGRARHNKM